MADNTSDILKLIRDALEKDTWADKTTALRKSHDEIERLRKELADVLKDRAGWADLAREHQAAAQGYWEELAALKGGEQGGEAPHQPIIDGYNQWLKSQV